MRKVMLAVLMLLGLAGCASKNATAHSDILNWDVPNSLVTEGTQSQKNMQAMAEIYKFTCGPNESFDLMDRAKFDQEFEKMLLTKGYRKAEVMNEGGAQLLTLIGPKPALAMLTSGRFTLCEVANQ
ncbi:hypothetical protein [Deinococcus hohokamensis]|uniref:Lipoprotein n=1 Tax=Deinococcus hohokamensis TaxID=309883 RepID=A0ABV9I6S3_9DEIO